jgi:quinol monooxygenase YgiN
MSVIVRAEVRVRLQDFDAFRDVAAQLVVASRSEPGTIHYRWFSSDDPATYVVVEEYEDERAAFVHNEHCGELLKQSSRVTELMQIQIHGELGHELVQWIDEHPQAHGFRALQL